MPTVILDPLRDGERRGRGEHNNTSDKYLHGLQVHGHTSCLKLDRPTPGSASAFIARQSNRHGSPSVAREGHLPATPFALAARQVTPPSLRVSP